MTSAPHCVTITPDQPFLNHLAGWILERFGEDSAALPQALVLLPTRRACRALREAFLDATGGRPILLPRIQPLGDLGDEALFPYHSEGAPALPAISALRRELLLTHLVRAGGRGHYGVEQAAQLARQLAQLIDDAAREDLSFDRLDTLAPQELAKHWQETLTFLTLVSQHWPKILQDEGAVDPARHRSLQLRALAQAWTRNPPACPVIAAGSTGSIPATAQLLAVIARLPQGTVVLPGLDTQMPRAQWDLVGPTHPQYGLKKLLERMEVERSEVTALYEPRITIHDSRIHCLSAIFQPPEVTAHWQRQTLPLAEGLRGVELATADTLPGEARMIAVALREVLETPGKTAALVTPDRQLARMVAAQMRRFGIAIDDSAGGPLTDTPPGCFLRLVAQAVAEGFAPAPLLALLRHPLAAAGMEPAECRALSRTLEIEALRGVRPAAGLEPLIAVAKQGSAAQRLLRNLADAAQEFTACFAHKNLPLRDLLQAHLRCAEALAATPQESGAQRLWAGEAGNALAAWLAELAQHAGVLGGIDPSDYPGLLDTLLAGQVHRPRFGLHPRLHILSPQEARLLQFDRVILGGLNEGAWPQGAPADPWMSRPMRAAFGLPPMEQSVGQSAHDVSLLCAAPRVLLTRARKVDGAPTVASRWLVRLATLVEGLDKAAYAAMQRSDHYAQGAALLDAPDNGTPPLERPEPCPPIEARPRSLRVTAVDTLLRDPYMIYADYILKLRPLEPLDEEPGAADFGTLVHGALERFIIACPEALPDNALALLLDCGRAAFAETLSRPAAAALWWPRFAAMAEWVIGRERERRGGLRAVMAELKGSWEFAVDGRPFALTTRIDRLDIGRNGAMTLIDYKTGAVPGKAEIEAGLANQLPLEALIARHGRLTPPPMGEGIMRMEYWKLSGNPEHCDIIPVDAALIEAARQRLENLVRRFDNPAVPYAAQSDPTLLTRYNDYAHLTRREEWEVI